MKKVAIVQSNYIPWKGYFDLISAVDEFILFDDVQFTRRDWRNRNKVKTAHGIQWLTVPVSVKGKYHQNICEVGIVGAEWATSHWKTLEQNYRSAAYFYEIAEWLKPIYLEERFIRLSDLNCRLIIAICNYLNINTIISHSSDYSLRVGKSERLADICKQAEATEYFSGPTAKNYLEENIFKDMGIELKWFDYSGYPSYQQLWGEFIHEVSIIDLLFNCGKNSHKYMRSTA
ncbi:WbqC family protein [Polynucleobacter paneuropaeus]|nr:WbqC family protein [Polynucleobacter paneuropaeus]